MMGMHNIYKSDYSNQVHQMNLSISQNHFLLKNGDIKYQAKKFDVTWDNYTRTNKRHLVNFLIRDHYSNCFYAEIHPIDSLPSIMDLLFNAWKEKVDYEFCGIPKNLILGKHILEMCPNLKTFAKTIGMNIQIATSGFTTGVRSLKDWENNLRFFHSFYSDCRNIKDFQVNSESICRDINMKESGKTEANLIKWHNGLKDGLIVNDKFQFESLYHS